MKNRSSLTIFTTILSAVACFGLLPQMLAAPQVAPPADGCYPGFTTAEGCNALNFLTTGAGNTGLGWYSLYVDTTGSYNTGVGPGALVLNNADSNTAVGAAALLLNTSGTENTANGTDALVYNDTGSENSAFGAFALFNSTGQNNTAIGARALLNNTSGSFNTAIGQAALLNNDTGGSNIAIGVQALGNNTSGSNNIALGDTAGSGLTTGSGNLYIGGTGSVAGESNHTYIQNINVTTVSGGGTDTVTVDLTTGLLGHLSSSRRYKEGIKSMDNTSEALFALKPVTYRYKKEIDSSQSLAFGLIAEEVADVNPDLVARNAEGQPEAVHYEMVNAMLLNEFLKEHRAFLEEQHKVAQQQKEIDLLKAELKEQRSLIQTVRDRIEMNRSKPEVVAND
jgi:hypothetical protein